MSAKWWRSTLHYFKLILEEQQKVHGLSIKTPRSGAVCFNSFSWMRSEHVITPVLMDGDPNIMRFTAE